MSYIFISLAAAWLFLGTDQATRLLKAYSPLQERRLLLMRVAGFFAMGAWIHLLPSVLLIIYMREEGILSTEVLNDDFARPVIASLYLLAPTLAIAGASCLGAVCGLAFGWRYRLLSIPVALDATGTSLALVSSYLLLDRDLVTAVFLALISVPVSAYFHLSLLTDAERQHRIYWAPFALICAITLALFGLSAETYHVISRQLRSFGSGGCADIKVHFREMNFAGKLILLTEHSTYILVVADRWEGAMCTIRIPANEALIAHAYESTESFVDQTPGGGAISEATVSQTEEYSKNASKICGPVGKAVFRSEGKVSSSRTQSDLTIRRSCSTHSFLSGALDAWIPERDKTLPEYISR
jgi:hypothetical protein